MFAHLKFSLILLAGMAISLSACNDIASRTQPTPSPATTPAASKTVNQKLPQGVSASGTQGLAAQTERINYKSIPLASIASSHSLKGNEPKAIALSAFGNIESEGGSREVKVENSQLDKAVVTITQTGVADDSIGAIRYRVEFVPTSESAQEGKQWKMVWAGSQFKCHLGRGHQDWSIEKCR